MSRVKGNWTGDAAANPPLAGLLRQDDLDGDGNAEEVRAFLHSVNAANEIATLETDNGSTAVTQAFVHDPNGNP